MYRKGVNISIAYKDLSTAIRELKLKLDIFYHFAKEFLLADLIFATCKFLNNDTYMVNTGC